LKIDVELEGMDSLIRKLDALGDDAPEALGAALYQEGERIMTTSKQEFVPVDTGTLRGTGHVEDPVVSGTSVSVTLGYGGPAAPYALVVHENRLLNHPNGGQWKYLERPALEATQNNKMPSRLAKSVNTWIKKTVGMR
jgi:hypothetical protein